MLKKFKDSYYTPSPELHTRVHSPSNFTRGQSSPKDPREDRPHYLLTFFETCPTMPDVPPSLGSIQDPMAPAAI